MQAAQQITFNQYGHGSAAAAARPKGLTAQLSTWLTRVFGCRHKEMSRPFTRDGESYRACLECGARRKFDSARWEMVGAYYYDAPKNQLSSLTRTASLILNPRATAASLSSGARS
jgi:hypothetical protein